MDSYELDELFTNLIVIMEDDPDESILNVIYRITDTVYAGRKTRGTNWKLTNRDILEASNKYREMRRLDNIKYLNDEDENESQYR